MDTSEILFLAKRTLSSKDFAIFREAAKTGDCLEFKSPYEGHPDAEIAALVVRARFGPDLICNMRAKELERRSFGEWLEWFGDIEEMCG